MSGSFDALASVAFGTIEQSFSRAIAFKSKDASYSDLITVGTVDNNVIRHDEYGNVLTQTAKRVCVRNSNLPTGLQTKDKIEIIDEGITYVIMDMLPDANVSTVFYLDKTA